MTFLFRRPSIMKSRFPLRDFCSLEAQLTESGFAPQYVNESALWPTLRQSTYTTILSGVSNGTGIGLVEFFEK